MWWSAAKSYFYIKIGHGGVDDAQAKNGFWFIEFIDEFSFKSPSKHLAKVVSMNSDEFSLKSLSKHLIQGESDVKLKPFVFGWWLMWYLLS